MPTTGKDYLERMAKTRAAHLKNIDATGLRIRGIYMEAARDLARRAAGAKAGSLTERWLTDYQRAVQNRMEQMRGELGLAIRGGMRASARLPGEAVEGWLGDALALCGVDGSFSGVLSQVPDDALRALLDGRMYRDGKSLSRRIWNKTDILQRNIEDVCAQALAQKKSALSLARDLEAYVNPEAKMPVSWLKTYPSIPFDRQIDYNAMRLARTMINHSYWAANLETAKRNPFCKAMHWALSPSHYERQVAHFGEDECDAYASHDEGLGRGNFPIDALPMPHAQCLCVQYQVVPELDAVADRLGAWVDGGSDPELDQAFGEWKASRNNTAANAAYTKELSGNRKSPPMDKKQFDKMVAGLNKHGVEVRSANAEELAYLNWLGAEATVLENNMILYSGERPSASAMFEEIIHLHQNAVYGKLDSGDQIELARREIEANSKVLRCAKAYGLTQEDIAEESSNLRKWKARYKELTGDDYDDV